MNQTTSKHQLTDADIERYRETGYLCPIPALTAAEATGLRSQLERFEASAGATLGKLEGQFRAKTHLLFPWLNQLCRHPAVTGPMSQLLGPNLLVYHVTCWLKEPGDASFVSWHQDGTYFHLDPPEHATAWVALSDSNLQSGCVQVIPGTHKAGQREHGTQPSEANLLSNGQTLVETIDPAKGVPLELETGQISIHDTFLVHSSGPNESGDRRIGIGISYVPTHVQYRGKSRVTATLALGEDRYGHFDPEPAPAADADDAARAFHASAVDRFFNSHGYERGAA